jgi:thiamine pyrophosphokinase
MNKRCVIFLNGVIENDEFIKGLMSKEDFILAVDGGFNHIKRLGLTPNLILGDFDSSEYKMALESTGKIQKYDSDKNTTDGEIAIDYVVENNFDKVIIVGALGNRIDHMLSNISMLEKLSDAGISGKIMSYKNEVSFLTDELVLYRGKYKYFSVLSITDMVSGLSIKNSRYDLDDSDLHRSESLCISNEFLGETVNISLKKGKAIVIKSLD